MPFIAYLKVKGQKQGDINGSTTLKGKENSIVVHAFSQQVISPRDPTSGLPTGKRQHQPISILKEVDRSTPKLWSALVNNENLIAWELSFWTPGPTGIETQVYSITLTNASIASIRDSMLDNEDLVNAKLPLREEITFTYQKIQWTWFDGGVTASDDWESPIS